MKVKYLIIVFLFISCFSFSQEKDLKKKDINKGWYFGPNISCLSIVGHYDERYGFYHYPLNSTYSKYYSYSVGINSMYAFGRKHTLTFGIQYREIRGSYNYYLDINPMWNPHEVSNIYGRSMENYLELPVHMDFCLIKRKFSPYIITGFTPTFFLTSKSFNRTTYINGKVEENSGNRWYYQRFDVSWQIGVGADINLAKSRIRIFVYNSDSQPFYFYSLLGWKSWGYSINSGISYYFKK